MKRLIVLLAVAAIAAHACKKKDIKDDLPPDEEILTKKIQDIIPQQYLDSLKKYGLELHTGTNPPNVEGNYLLTPAKLVASNRENENFPIGYTFRDSKFKLYEQHSTDFSIKLFGRHFLNAVDESIATAISGSGNKFTVYGKVKTTLNAYHSIFAIVISGEKDGQNLKNIRYGFINIDHSNGSPDVMKEGEARIVEDADFVTERITEDVQTTAASKPYSETLPIAVRSAERVFL